MEIKGETVELTYQEIEKTQYPSIFSLQTCSGMREQLKADKDSMIRQRAEDGLTPVERAMLLPMHAMLVERGILLDSIQRATVLGMTIDREWADFGVLYPNS